MTTPATKLEQSFAYLCGKHELDCLSVQYSTGAYRHFTAYAHDRGECDSGMGDTIAQAVGGAITALNVKRGRAEPIALADEALPELGA